jgi:hypothetical protein
VGVAGGGQGRADYRDGKEEDMTVDEKWLIIAKFITPDKLLVARAAYFAGYAEALAPGRDPDGATKVLDELREGKCG